MPAFDVTLIRQVQETITYSTTIHVPEAGSSEEASSKVEALIMNNEDPLWSPGWEEVYRTTDVDEVEVQEVTEVIEPPVLPDRSDGSAQTRPVRPHDIKPGMMIRLNDPDGIEADHVVIEPPNLVKFPAICIRTAGESAYNVVGQTVEFYLPPHPMADSVYEVVIL